MSTTILKSLTFIVSRVSKKISMFNFLPNADNRLASQPNTNHYTDFQVSQKGKRWWPFCCFNNSGKQSHQTTSIAHSPFFVCLFNHLCQLQRHCPHADHHGIPTPSNIQDQLGTAALLAEVHGRIPYQPQLLKGEKKQHQSWNLNPWPADPSTHKLCA